MLVQRPDFTLDMDELKNLDFFSIRGFSELNTVFDPGIEDCRTTPQKE
jgi:hypothetical protein